MSSKILFVVSVFLFPTQANAYFDGGFVSILFQAAAGILVFVATGWFAIKEKAIQVFGTRKTTDSGQYEKKDVSSCDSVDEVSHDRARTELKNDKNSFDR